MSQYWDLVLQSFIAQLETAHHPFCDLHSPRHWHFIFCSEAASSSSLLGINYKVRDVTVYTKIAIVWYDSYQVAFLQPALIPGGNCSQSTKLTDGPEW